MSTRDDARLTARERAALSDLEASAAAEDPQFADRLRGPGRWRAIRALPAVPAWVRGLWFGIAALVAGLALVVAGISAGWPLGVAGACVAAAGLWALASWAETRLRARGSPGG